MRVGEPRTEARPASSGDAVVERAAREHAALVYRVARAVLRNHHDAEDASQEVFLRVLRFRRGLDGVEDARKYLARVAYRVALDRRSRPSHVSLEDAGVSDVPSGEAGADDRAAAEQVRALVAGKVASLPEDLKHAVRLSTVAGLTSSEIGQVLGIPEGTVRTRLMRARRLLRVALAAALGLALAAVGILLRRSEPEKTAAGRPAAPPAAPLPGDTPREPGVSSKGGDAGAGEAPRRLRGPEYGASTVLARASATPPSKKIFFPSPGPLSEQETLLLAYVKAIDPDEAGARSGFLDEPAPLPPLPSDSPSLVE